jgi:aspartyl-tRNA synthetase
VPRSELDALTDHVKRFGAGGLVWAFVQEDGGWRSPIAKFLSEDELALFRADPGSTVLFGADTPLKASAALGALRTHLGRELGLADDARDEFLWVLDFPLFEPDEETGGWTFVHHPFTGVHPGHEELMESDPGAALSQAYDLVWNGWELGSGSIRIHRQDVQQRVFSALGMTKDEAESKFGFLLEALRMGAPPHGGFAMGIDRLVALLAGEPNIREVTAFPKVSSGSDPLTGAPTPLAEAVQQELAVRVVASE